MIKSTLQINCLGLKGYAALLAKKQTGPIVSTKKDNAIVL